MTDLVERLEGAAAGSRELDREIMALSYSWEQRHIGVTCWDDEADTCCPGSKHLSWVWVDQSTDQWETDAKDGFEFTSSIDAAVALAERVLPDREVSMAQRKPRHMETCGEWWIVSLFKVRTGVVFGAGPDTVTTKAATPALALCAAIIRAHAEQVQG
jgi:hypothetical protein